MLGFACVLVSYMFLYYFFFFFNDTATTEIYTLSLHDALLISASSSYKFRSSIPWANLQVESPTTSTICYL